MTGRAWWARLDMERLVLLVTLASVFAMAARVPVDHDGWWHLATGRHIAEEGVIPRADPFSHTRAGARWIDNGWLAQVGLYAAYRWLGYVGLGLVVALAVVATMGLVWAQMEGGAFVRAFTVVLAATVSGPVWTVRPHLGTYLLTAALGLVLHAWRRGRRRALWLVVPLFVAWVNVHAGYVLGLGLVGLVAVGAALDRIWGGEDARPWRDIGWLVGAGAVAAALVVLNPYGVAMWRYPFYNAGQAFAGRYIAEWASPDFHRAGNQPFAAMVLVTLMAVGVSERRGRWAELLPVAAFAYLALRSQRAMGLFAVVAAPVLAHHAASAVEGVRERIGVRGRTRAMTPRRAVVNGALAVAVMGGAGLKAGMVWREPVVEAAVEEMGFPVEAVAWIAENEPPGELYNPYNWGGYLIWRLYPDYRVFVDGRADMYGDEFLLEYVEVASAAPGWEEVLAAHGVCTALVEVGGGLAGAMEGDGDWERVYGNEVAAVYVRSSDSCG